MYFDRFTDRYVKEKDESNPPERYTKVLCSETGIFTETWVTGYNQELSIAYTEDTWRYNLVDSLRKNMAEANRIKLLWLRHISIPKEYYDVLEKEIENDSSRDI